MKNKKQRFFSTLSFLEIERKIKYSASCYLFQQLTQKYFASVTLFHKFGTWRLNNKFGRGKTYQMTSFLLKFHWWILQDQFLTIDRVKILKDVFTLALDMGRYDFMISKLSENLFLLKREKRLQSQTFVCHQTITTWWSQIKLDQYLFLIRERISKWSMFFEAPKDLLNLLRLTLTLS